MPFGRPGRSHLCHRPVLLARNLQQRRPHRRLCAVQPALPEFRLARLTLRTLPRRPRLASARDSVTHPLLRTACSSSSPIVLSASCPRDSSTAVVCFKLLWGAATSAAPSPWSARQNRLSVLWAYQTPNGSDTTDSSLHEDAIGSLLHPPPLPTSLISAFYGYQRLRASWPRFRPHHLPLMSLSVTCRRAGFPRQALGPFVRPLSRFGSLRSLASGHGISSIQTPIPSSGSGRGRTRTQLVCDVEIPITNPGIRRARSIVSVTLSRRSREERNQKQA